MKRWVIILVLAAVLILGWIIIKGNNKNLLPASGKIPVSASFYPVYFFAQQIGGNKADISNITPSGAEPHDYEPTAQDMARIEQAKLLILNGGGLEAWANSLEKNLDKSKTVLVVAGEGLTNKEIIEGGEKMTDPHIWLAPPLAEKMVDKITAGFTGTDPANKTYYEQNAKTLKDKMVKLDEEYKAGLAQCSSKDIITSHAAFGYLAETYGLNQVPISGLSPDAEPSSKELADIVKFAKENKVKYIFFESLVSPKLSETVAREVGAQTLVLNPIEGISDEDRAEGKDYFSEMGSNLINLQLALGCIK